MYGYEHMAWGGLWMVLIWAVPIVLSLLLVRRFAGDRPGKSAQSALEILEARYASGAIDREEYRKRRADLESGGIHPQGG